MARYPWVFSSLQIRMIQAGEEGGLLDRMDSLLFCAPVAVLYLHFFAV